MKLDPIWEYVADRVMGGVSSGDIAPFDGGMRLTGRVSLENNGGFVQMAFDLLPGGQDFDATGFAGIELEMRGNGERYDLRLRTSDLDRPWQSYRAEFVARPDWQTLKIPFAEFTANRTDVPFNASRLRRIGVLAIGRVFEADITVRSIALYKGPDA